VVNLSYVNQINGFCEKLKATAVHLEQQVKEYESVQSNNMTSVKQLANRCSQSLNMQPKSCVNIPRSHGGNMTKKVMIAAIFLAAILVGGTGCMLNRIMNAGNTQQINQQAISLLEQKYAEVFTYAAPCGNSMTGTREFFVTCDSFPGQRILVQIENSRENNRVVRDNYLAVKYREETVAFVKACMGAACPDVNVYYEVPLDGMSEELGAATTFEEFLADDQAQMVVMVELKNGSCAGKLAIEESIRKINETCKNMVLTIVVVEDEVFGTLDRDGLNHRIAKKDYVIQTTAYIKGDCVEWTWRGEV
jgi:hypothetical protein